jgi:hypothetical protein
MENLQNAIQEGSLAQMLNDAIADINYKSEIDLLNKKTYIYIQIEPERLRQL